MKLSFSPQQLAELEWVEWENRQMQTKAHCVDPTSEQRTGKKRTVSGAVVPKKAVPARSETLRDEFSLQVVQMAARKWREDNEAAKKAATEPRKEASPAQPANPPEQPPRPEAGAKEPRTRGT